MLISIIIINYNTKEYLERCLNSIYSEKQEFDLEILVVDNCSNDGSPEVVKKYFPEVKLIANKENLGFSQAINQGLKLVKSEYILVLNADTELLKDTLKNSIKFITTHPEVAAIGLRLLNSDGTLQTSAYSFPDFTWAFFHLIRIRDWFPQNRIFKKTLGKYFTHYWEHNEIRKVDWVIGAAIMLRKKALKEIGLFDENFFLYFEEIDWCKRAKNKGWKIYFIPHACVIHHLEQSSKKEIERAFIERYKSMFYYYKKWHGEVQLIFVKLITIIIFLIKIFLNIFYSAFKPARENKIKSYLKVIKLALG